jgi:hypothetical protein
VEWSAGEARATSGPFGSCPVQAHPLGESWPALRACAAAQLRHVTHVEATIDGVPLRPESLRQLAIDSPPGVFAPVPDNPFGVPPGVWTFAADGYWALVKPLAPGTHRITYRGIADFQAELGSTFDVGRTYDLQVGP